MALFGAQALCARDVLDAAGVAGEAIFQQLCGGVGSGVGELLLTDRVGAPSQYVLPSTRRQQDTLARG